MSMAQRISYSPAIDGTSAPKLTPPPAERAPRRAVKPASRRGNRLLWIAGGLTWVVIMGFSFALVYLNTLAQTEIIAITKAREELTLIQRRNLEMEARLVQSGSVTAVEKWAAAKGMKRPIAINTLKVEESAVALRQTQTAGEAQSTGAQGGLWGAFRSYIGRMAGSLNLVSSPR